MKKFLLSFGCLLGLATAASATDYVISTIDMTSFSKSTYTYDGKDKEQLAGIWTAEDGTVFNVVLKQQASTTNTDNIISQSSQCRWYKNYELTITSPANVGDMTQIIFNVDGASYHYGFTPNAGTVTDNSTDITWTCANGANPFIGTATEGQIRFNKVTIHTGEISEGGDTPVDPNPGEGGDTEDTDGILLNGWTNYTWIGDGNGWTADVNGYTISTAKASSSNDLVKPDQYSIRVYQGATLTITAPEGVQFDKILIGLDTNTKGYTATADGWVATTGSADDPQFTMSSATGHNTITLSSDKQLRVASITIYAGSGTDVPDVPVTPTETITVAQALDYITSGNIPAGQVSVKGIISEIEEVSAQYGNATFTIVDALTDANGLVIYRAKWLEGASFTGDEIERGGTIVVKGTLVDYYGTPEMTTGGVVISYEAPTGEVPQPEQPTGENVTFDFSDITSLTPAYTVEDGVAEYDVTDVTFTSGIITLTGTATEEASTKPRLYMSTAGAWTYRFYKDNTITIASDDAEYLITAIEFNATNLANESVVFSNGTFANNKFTPNDAKGVSSMTITKTATGNNPTIAKVTVYYAKSGAAIDAVEADTNAPVEYFNLQGVRVTNPENGLYIMRQGNKVTKVIR